MSAELKIALVQSPLSWEQPETNRAAFSRKLDKVSEGTGLIVLPEMFSTGFTMEPWNIEDDEGLRTLEWMQEEAAKRDTAICGSIVFREDSQFFNRLFFVSPDGNYQAYDKRHTFTLAGEHKVYASGNSKQLIEYKGFRICPLICYDLRFPVWSRNVEGYDLLLYVANWPAPRIGAWDALLKARAIENLSYCAGVNRVGADSNGHLYSGHSAVYDALGERLVYSEKAEILYASLSLDHLRETRQALKFLDDRDSFTLAP
jgi:predicted amidohydrolase